MTVTHSQETRPRDIGKLVVAEIRAELARQDLTQGDLAARVQQNQQWVSRRLSGQVQLTMLDADLMAAALDTSVITLTEAALMRLGWRGPTPEPPRYATAQGAQLPRLDSNQQPADYRSSALPLVSAA